LTSFMQAIQFQNTTGRFKNGIVGNLQNLLIEKVFAGGIGGFDGILSAFGIREEFGSPPDVRIRSSRNL
jgi:hypothetical protein